MISATAGVSLPLRQPLQRREAVRNGHLLGVVIEAVHVYTLIVVNGRENLPEDVQAFHGGTFFAAEVQWKRRSIEPFREIGNEVGNRLAT